jgi:hypothetical protein
MATLYLIEGSKLMLDGHAQVRAGVHHLVIIFKTLQKLVLLAAQLLSSLEKLTHQEHTRLSSLRALWYVKISTSSSSTSPTSSYLPGHPKVSLLEWKPRWVTQDDLHTLDRGRLNLLRKLCW